MSRRTAAASKKPATPTATATPTARATSKKSKSSEATVVKIKTHGVPDGRSYVFINSDQCIRFDT